MALSRCQGDPAAGKSTKVPDQSLPLTPDPTPPEEGRRLDEVFGTGRSDVLYFCTQAMGILGNNMSFVVLSCAFHSFFLDFLYQSCRQVDRFRADFVFAEPTGCVVCVSVLMGHEFHTKTSNGGAETKLGDDNLPGNSCCNHAGSNFTNRGTCKVRFDLWSSGNLALGTRAATFALGLFQTDGLWCFGWCGANGPVPSSSNREGQRQYLFFIGPAAQLAGSHADRS